MDESGITNAVQRHNEDNDGFTIVGGRKKEETNCWLQISALKLRAACTKIVSGQCHSSFKVTLRTTQPKLLYDSNLWPEGVLLR